MLKVILDTNVFLVCISKRSRLRWIFDNLLKGTFLLYVTTDILLEYAEKLEEHLSPEVSKNVMKVLENLTNIRFVKTYYKFGLIEKDWDDNKFVDCAIATNASFIVSHDTDFKVLKPDEFPWVEVGVGQFSSKTINLRGNGKLPLKRLPF